MASLKDIKRSITEMTWDEQLAIHEAVRLSRATPKRPIKAKKKKEKGITKSIVKGIDSMSLEELEALSKQIGGRLK